MVIVKCRKASLMMNGNMNENRLKIFHSKPKDMAESHSIAPMWLCRHKNESKKYDTLYEICRVTVGNLPYYIIKINRKRC